MAKIEKVDRALFHDKRTGIALAPGAVRNWPTQQEEEEIKRFYKEYNEHMRLTKVGLRLAWVGKGVMWVM